MTSSALRTRKRRPTPLERFESFTNTAGPVPAHRPDLGPCHVWTGSLYPDGYAKFWFDGRTVRGARWICEADGTPIPDGHEPDHLCRNRACVRRSHLEVVTQQENLRRAGLLRRGRQIGQAEVEAAKTHCPAEHPYDDENTRVTKDGKRVCRACNRARARAAYRAQKAGA